jgi:hypothetical protein
MHVQARSGFPVQGCGALHRGKGSKMNVKIYACCASGELGERNVRSPTHVFGVTVLKPLTENGDWLGCGGLRVSLWRREFRCLHSASGSWRPCGGAPRNQEAMQGSRLEEALNVGEPVNFVRLT